jgi:hypothetical protein
LRSLIVQEGRDDGGRKGEGAKYERARREDRETEQEVKKKARTVRGKVVPLHS